MIPAAKINELVSLRRHLLSVLKLVESELNQHHPICRHCFFAKGMIDRCECDRRYLTVGVSG